MNWANRITLLRIFLIPIIIVLMIIVPFPGTGFYHGWSANINIIGKNMVYSLPYSYLIAGILFLIASLTDFLDGYIARKYHQVTTFGKFFDAIADKLLTNTVLIVFACANILPIWMVVILIARDFLIDVVRQILATKTVVMSANQLGKIKTALEMFGMFLVFFVGYRFFNGQTLGTGKWDEFGWINQIIMIPMYLTTLLSVISAGNYIYLNRKALFDFEVLTSPKLMQIEQDKQKDDKKGK